MDGPCNALESPTIDEVIRINGNDRWGSVAIHGFNLGKLRGCINRHLPAASDLSRRPDEQVGAICRLAPPTNRPHVNQRLAPDGRQIRVGFRFAGINFAGRAINFEPLSGRKTGHLAACG